MQEKKMEVLEREINGMKFVAREQEFLEDAKFVDAVENLFNMIQSKDENLTTVQIRQAIYDCFTLMEIVESPDIGYFLKKITSRQAFSLIVDVNSLGRLSEEDEKK